MFKINKNSDDWGYSVLLLIMAGLLTLFLNSCTVYDNMKDTARVSYNVKTGKVGLSTKPNKHITLRY